MPGHNAPDYNTLKPPGTRAPKAWSNFWHSVALYDVKRSKQTRSYINAIRRGK